MGSLLYMTHPLCVSHYCGVVTAVGLRGGLGGLFIFLVLLYGECVDFCEDTDLALLRLLQRDPDANGPLWLGDPLLAAHERFHQLHAAPPKKFCIPRKPGDTT